MEGIGGVLSSFSTRMDLNQEPIEALNLEREPISLRSIQLECRRKVCARIPIVRRYGEEGYEKVIQDPSPFLILGTRGTSVILFILF